MEVDSGWSGASKKKACQEKKAPSTIQELYIMWADPTYKFTTFMTVY
jgi:hypothetical protein